jgi:tetratricopeptide (TPR) repeat protein
LRRTGEAIATVSGALKTDPENPKTHTQRGWLLLQENRPHPAKRHFLEALRLEPNSRGANRGFMHARLACAVSIYGWMLAGLMWLRRGKLMIFVLILLIIAGDLLAELIIPRREALPSGEFMYGLIGDASRSVLVWLVAFLTVFIIPAITRSIYIAFRENVFTAKQSKSRLDLGEGSD